MTTEEIIQGNKMIAEFMGIKTKIYSDTPTVIRWQYGNSMLFESDLKYHSSWDWLMPVVEKIESTTVGAFNIFKNETWIADELYRNTARGYHKQIKANSKIDAVYNGVIQFIQWYNDNLKNQQP